MELDETLDGILQKIARERGTPCYVYFLEEVQSRATALREAFGGRFEVSFAVKSNPNVGLLAALRGLVETLDVSSIAEAERALRAGYTAAELTFSGPAKRRFELERAVELGIGEMVCESAWELEQLDRLAGRAGRKVDVVLRINPRRVPPGFGVSMAGRASQFGIDEEDLDAVVERLESWKHLVFAGWHVYSGTNSLKAEAIAENFGIFVELFERFSEQHVLRPRKLVFGSGFGIPYQESDRPLHLEQLADLVAPLIDRVRSHPLLGVADCVLEMGRWLVGTSGYFLTSVINEKRSRGVEIRMCDAGFNNHLAACGMMGTVIRRNWRFAKLGARPNEVQHDYHLVGPLCTTIDLLATAITLPVLERGDVLAIGSSGAYGLTASPTRFISHPEPREFLVAEREAGSEVVDVTESTASYPQGNSHLPGGRIVDAGI